MWGARRRRRCATRLLAVRVRSRSLLRLSWCCDALRQVVALDQFHHNRTHAATFFEAVDVRDIRVIECRQRLRLACEPPEPVGVAGERIGQYLQRDIAD